MKEVNGTYGSNHTPCTVFYYDGWYCAEGSVNVNRTADDVEEGVNIEELSDYDTFTWSSPIESLDELVEAVEG